MSTLPRVRRVRQTFHQPRVERPGEEARRAVMQSRLRERVRPGGSVALAVGSRGIRNLLEMVQGALAAIRELGFDPFVVAAMGTHGRGLAEGQRQLLAEYGVTESALGVPVRTDMDAVKIGVSDAGYDVYWDRNALAADGVVALNRVKAHTDYTGPYESGVLKMLVIGLGKRESPLQAHALGTAGLAKLIPAAGRLILEKTRFALGVAVVENAAEETALVRGVEPEELFDVEPTLLATAKAWMGRLPFEEAEILIIGELGKNFSGAGIDPNVIGRRLVEGELDFPSPRIRRIAVLDVSPESHGNAVGMGLADLTTQRLIDQIDHAAVRLNTLTAQFLQRSRSPIALPTDRDVIEACLNTCWQPNVDDVRLAIIPNTLELSELYVTAPLAKELLAPGATIELGPTLEFPFVKGDRLDQALLFPHSAHARRAATTSVIR